MAIWGVGVMVGPILGPTLGGWLTEYYNWRWVFYINLPFGILAFARHPRLRDGDRRNAGAKLDWFGFATLSLAIGALQLMLDRGEQLDWFCSAEISSRPSSPRRLLPVHRPHLHRGQPVPRPALFTDRNFATGLVFIFIVGIVLLARWRCCRRSCRT